MDLARRQNDENPAFYVQYAHARIASILRYGAERGLAPLAGDVALEIHFFNLPTVGQLDGSGMHRWCLKHQSHDQQ